MNDLPNIRHTIFWDTDFEKIDFSKNYERVIIRVFERGKLNDLIEIIRFYGKTKVSEVLTSQDSLSERTLNLAANILSISKNKFKCFNKQQTSGYSI